MPPPSVPLSAIRQPAFLYDRDGAIIEANEPAEALAGQGLAGLSLADAIHTFRYRRRDGTPLTPEELPACHALAGEEVFGDPFVVTLGDGRIIDVLVSASAIHDGDAIVGALVVWQDVTEQNRTEEALRESEERLRDIFDLSLDAVYRRDLVTGRVDYISPVNETLTGFTAEEFGAFSREEFLDRVHPDDRAKVNAIIAAGMSGTCTKMSGMIEYRFRCRDGSYRWLSDHFTFQAGEDGRPRHRVGVIRDVTRRKETEAALRERDLRLNLALDVAAIGTFDWNIATGEEAWDNRIRAQWGLPPGVPVDRGVFNAGIHPDDLPAVEEGIHRALDPAGDGRYAAEYRVLGLCDGIERRISARGQAFFDGDRPLRMIGTTIDITEQRRTEEAVREQERILQSIFRAAPSGIGLVSGLHPGRRLLQANDQFLAMTGYDRSELIGQHTRLLYLDDEAYAAVGREMARQLETCGWGEVETKWRRKDGAVFDLLLSSSLIDPTDPDDGVIFIALDLTNLHESQKSLQRYTRDLKRSNEELQRFAYVASHDLQEPLRPMVSFSQLLERRYKGRLDADADEYLHYIVEGGQRMQALIQDLLQLSRIETKAQPAVLTDANGPVGDALRSLEPAICEAGATVTVDPLPAVVVDPAQLEPVFLNLIGNAIKYRHPDRPLEVRVEGRRAGPMVEFSVADNGIGIEPEYYNRIFVIFQRLHTHDKYTGTGIGLAVVKKIVERHGGTVWVESVPGEGSTFFFTLPAVRIAEDIGP